MMFVKSVCRLVRSIPHARYRLHQGPGLLHAMDRDHVEDLIEVEVGVTRMVRRHWLLVDRGFAQSCTGQYRLSELRSKEKWDPKTRHTKLCFRRGTVNLPPQQIRTRTEGIASRVDLYTNHFGMNDRRPTPSALPFCLPFCAFDSFQGPEKAVLRTEDQAQLQYLSLDAEVADNT